MSDCSDCKYELESREGKHCKYCKHNYLDKFEPKDLHEGNNAMTVLEAISELKEIIDSEFQTEKQEEAYSIAISALEKQIPKRPVETKVNFFMNLENIKELEDVCRLDFICPNCYEAVVGQPYTPNHCKHCGQKLDWEGE